MNCGRLRSDEHVAGTRVFNPYSFVLHFFATPLSGTFMSSKGPKRKASYLLNAFFLVLTFV